MSKENKPNGDLEDIRSQADDLLKSLDLVDTPSESSPKSTSTKDARESPPAKPTAQKSSSSSSKTVLVAAGSLAGLSVVIIGGLIGLEFSKQATLNLKSELAAQEARASRETAARVQAELARERENAAIELAERERAAKEQAAIEQAAREQAAREQVARERAEREQAARERESSERAARAQAERDRVVRERKEAERLASLRTQLKSKGWSEAGSSGLLFRWCTPGSEDSKIGLGPDCSAPNNARIWFGIEFYCLSKNCSGVIEGTFGSNNWIAQERVSLGYIRFKLSQRRVFTFNQTKYRPGVQTWISKAGGYCGDARWEKC